MDTIHRIPKSLHYYLLHHRRTRVSRHHQRTQMNTDIPERGKDVGQSPFKNRGIFITSVTSLPRLNRNGVVSSRIYWTGEGWKGTQDDEKGEVPEEQNRRNLNCPRGVWCDTGDIPVNLKSSLQGWGHVERDC